MSAEQSTTGFPCVTYNDWRTGVESDLKGTPFEKKLIGKTYEGISLQPLYTEEDIGNLTHRLSFPGFNPFARGATATGPIEERWQIIQPVRGGDISTANQLIKEEIAGGATGIIISISHRSGSAKPPALAIENSSDFEILCREIDPSTFNWFVNLEGNFLSFLGVLERFCATSGISLSALRIHFFADPFTDFLCNGGETERLKAGMDDLAETIRWCEKAGSPFRTAGIDATLYHNLGATAVQELAFALAEASDMMHHFESNAVSPSAAAGRIFISFGIGPFFFMEIAKLRAARMLWWHLINSFGINHTPLYVHAITGKYQLSSLDPHTNILRSTTETLSSVLSGCDAATVYPFDLMRNGSTGAGRRLARNTQLILREESHVDAVIDPVGGSYYVESLTAALAEGAWELLRAIEGRGGMSQAVAAGFVQRELESAHSARQKDVATRKRTIIGVNKYADVSEELTDNAGVEHPGEGRLSIPFERLRLRAKRFKEKFGKKPTVLLAAFGALKQYKPRVDFSRLYFEAGGFTTIISPPLNEASDAGEHFGKTKASIVAICSSDDNYPAVVPAVVTELRRVNQSLPVVLAGYPKEHIDTFRGAGVTEFIYSGSDATAILSRLYDLLGV